MDKRIDLIQKRISAIRPKILDFTRRNPLISTKFSDRSNSLIRIVDEVAEVLIEKLAATSMRIVPLPDLDSEPKDEKSVLFQSALAVARINDSKYLSDIDGIDQNSDDAPNLLQRAERTMKDRLRDNLGLTPRQTKNDLSLSQHAKNHDISPSYDLPTQEQLHKDGRHTDLDIQTLLLPDVLNRRLNMLDSKERSWKEETGISVLHFSFGFIEWAEVGSENSQYSPLLRIPIELEKKRTPEGQEFWISSDECIPEDNPILAEKLRSEFDIEFPKYENQGLDKYFTLISKLQPKGMKWRVRRWAAIGVFPSARLAMYEDLDPDKWDFSKHSGIADMFGGTESGNDVSPFADEYNIDDPLIESKVPYLIADADSSQFSVLVDIANGKNLAVEGPPGTGKSQTIVNAIAASIQQGKKVLFIAEKSAALEVVKSKLDAFGLGDFVLPLQASRASKAQFIGAIKKRIELKSTTDPKDLDDKINRFKTTRDRLNTYVSVLTTEYGDTGKTIYTILSDSIVSRSAYLSLSDELKAIVLPPQERVIQQNRSNISKVCDLVEELWEGISILPKSWKNIQRLNIDPFTAQEILSLAADAAVKFQQAIVARQELKKFDIDSEFLNIEAISLYEVIFEVLSNPDSYNFNLVSHISTEEKISHVKEYVNNLQACTAEEISLAKIIKRPLNSSTHENLVKFRSILIGNKLDIYTDHEIERVKNKYKTNSGIASEIDNFFQQSKSLVNEYGDISSYELVKILDLVESLDSKTINSRNVLLGQPAIQQVVVSLSKLSKNLREERKIFGGEYHLHSLHDSNKLNEYSEFIFDAGIFKLFSKDYNNAKKYFNAIKIDKGFNRINAANELKRLSSYKKQLEEVEGNDVLKNVFKHESMGIDSDFPCCLDIINCYNKVDEILAGSEFSEIKNIIKFGDKNIIYALPKIPKNHAVRNIKKISCVEAKNILLRCENKANKFDEDVKNIKALRDHYVNTTTLDEVKSLPERLEKFFENREKLESKNDIKEALNDFIESNEIDESVINNSLSLAGKVLLMSESAQLIFFDNLNEERLVDLSELLNVVVGVDKIAMDALSLLSLSTDTNIEIWSGNSYRKIVEKLSAASTDKEGLIAYSRLLSVFKEFNNFSYIEFAKKLLDSEGTGLRLKLESVMAANLAKSVYQFYGNKIMSFSGVEIESLRSELINLDEEIIKLSRKRIQATLVSSSNPPMGNGAGKKSEYTELSLLRHQTSLQRPSASIRRITEKSASALLELKPCWMMSPLAVAQYIQKGQIEFDLVIIDEASQMTPENAIGAIARSKQAMIVGDTNQLPPSNFFRKLVNDDDIDEDEKVTEESILEIANITFKPKRQLRWHYRSRHSGLIAFSNKHIYKNLIIFPSPEEMHPNFGVKYINVHGLYSSGTNHIEAKKIIDDVVIFMRDFSEKSLGLVVLNQKQRDLISEEMNLAIENNPHVISYIEFWENKDDGLEKFFIKNLENVQGDERDVIFIGTVYGPEQEGAPVLQRFGPINGIAGKRRLNVLFSRAKEKIVTYSSMNASDIRAEEDGNAGAYMLRCWLEYAATGILEGGVVGSNEPDSPFEEYVIDQIKAIGCEPVPQVGVKGFSIDIGIRHPDWPHGFIMGVECDGATYHSSVSARDRDKHRQNILEGLGWNLYRIWSTDWFEDPLRETEKLRLAIIQRVTDLKESSILN